MSSDTTQSYHLIRMTETHSSQSPLQTNKQIPLVRKRIAWKVPNNSLFTSTLITISWAIIIIFQFSYTQRLTNAFCVNNRFVFWRNACLICIFFKPVVIIYDCDNYSAVKTIEPSASWRVSEQSVINQKALSFEWGGQVLPCCVIEGSLLPRAALVPSWIRSAAWTFVARPLLTVLFWTAIRFLMVEVGGTGECRPQVPSASAVSPPRRAELRARLYRT